MYELTLTAAERQAIDWVAHRYATGDNLFRALIGSAWEGEWGGPDPITFTIPEHLAWEIYSFCEVEDFLFPCFAPSLPGC